MRPVLVTFFVIGSMPFVGLGQSCPAGGAANGKHTISLLEHAPSCAAADRILHACAWGSSMDLSFAEIVSKRCEAQFLPTLSKSSRARYDQEIRICGQGMPDGVGTMALSEAGICSADISFEYATKPEVRKRAPQRASFDCGRASSALEKLICADTDLGDADIALSRMFKGAIRFDPKDETQIRASERRWSASLPLTCPPEQTTKRTSACLLEAFSARIAALGGCMDEDDQFVRCLDEATAAYEPKEPDKTR